ncbi:YdcF family protein [Deinococcus humi]|uniref:DUF218 domain-containing protein n=1 Tax=Deinococcus humi TaxID=662880 RepID=A0A7W8JVB7_9DEIO|nr:YdcF family protein [Deinococcus humi]MBB5363488.1 hypothetical protein [Deinococcus humi]GGO30539.1 hypothetical protein GCM10008949_25540 [Deinococcus humi]
MGKALSITFAVTALGGLSTAFLFTPLFPLALKAFEISMPPEQADVIVILGSDINCDDREPDKVGAVRINKGLALFQAGYSSALTVTDADPVRPPGCPTMREIQKEYIDGKLKAAGELRKPQVFVLEHAKDTRQEAMRVTALAHQQGWKTMLLVSSPLHLRRGVLLFSRAGVRVVPVASDEFRYAAQLPTVKERWVALRLLGHEVLGFIQAFFPISSGK